MLIIINPTAARGRAAHEWAEARHELLSRGLSFKEIFTSHRQEATKITRQAILSGELSVIAVGGDGTLNEVINGYFDERGRAINSDAAIGLLPSGTGSDFRRSLGLMTREVALQALMTHRTQMLDAVRVELINRECRPALRYAINLVSFGFGGDAVRLVDEWRDSWPNWIGGKARFYAAALKALGKYRLQTVKLSFDGEREMEIESNFLVAANGRFAGSGMMLAPHADLTDGLLDVVLTDRASRWVVIKELPSIQRGAHLENPKVRELRTKQFLIETARPMAVDIDGEPAGFTPAILTVLPSAIRFITGTDLAE